MGPTAYLYVPGNKLEFVENALNIGAENIFIDTHTAIIKVILKTIYFIIDIV